MQGVSRRATASATRKTPQFLTSSTLWYSGIFAAAATYDAAAKKQRREQWDHAILEVKQDLAKPVEAPRSSEDRHVHESTGAPAGAPVREPDDEGDLFKYVEPFQERPQWPTNTGPPLNIRQLPPQSLYASDARKAHAALSRGVPKKLERTMLAVDEFQLWVFSALRNDDGRYDEDVTSSISLEYRDKMIRPVDEAENVRMRKREDIRRLRFEDSYLTNWQRADGDVPLCRYTEDDSGAYQQTQRELNASLQQLFRLHASKNISTRALLVKVIHNLHLSTAAPNLHTWNTLLLGFKQTDMPKLTKYAIAAMQTIVIRPNEITNVATLDHFREMDECENFIWWIELMRGFNGGLMLAHPNTVITEENRLTLKERETVNSAMKKKIYRLPYPTPNVFASIIKGVIKFSGFHSALQICEAMGHEGWGLCMSGLSPLLANCAERGDWDSGLAVWDQIQALKTRSSRRHGKHGFREEVIALESYAAMIKLCTKARQKSVFQDVWEQANEVHPTKLRSLIAMVQPGKAVPEAPPLEALVDTVDAMPEEVVGSEDMYLDDTSVGRSVAELEMLEMESDFQTQFPQQRQQPLVRAHMSGHHRRDAPTHEQLMGWTAAGHDLDEYRQRERPMALRA
ncbi:hypothetical protein Tdes44962_MAKER01965 [Teratosphaeria destructans]|uniref:Uncharacterized protein n=1 Tax=Teratosphaeria destructans TaxID=418781 RepID=A0A9W7SVY6_9PEZI|nr:hypothetical protein Tdes44962_MAKER01965 [Teratosphaeria destructans]